MSDTRQTEQDLADENREEEIANPTDDVAADAMRVEEKGGLTEDEVPEELKNQEEEGQRTAKRKRVLAFGVVLVAVLGLAFAFVHVWTPATCTEPEKCMICGTTRGEPLGHDWEPATCLTRKKCKVCGAIDGKRLGHKIDPTTQVVTIEPTCTEEGTLTGECARCGQKIQGTVPKLDHVKGDWVDEKAPVVNRDGSVTPGEKVVRCTVCGAVLDSEETTLELSMSQKNALVRAQDYLALMPFSRDGLVEQLEFEGFPRDDAEFAVDHCGADWNKQAEKKAADYLDMMSFSHSGLVEQLIFEGFTSEQAEHGVASTGL